jgi:hypothetical protein
MNDTHEVRKIDSETSLEAPIPGRPRIGPKIQVRLDSQALAALDSRAEEHGTRSAQIRRAVDEYLARL